MKGLACISTLEPEVQHLIPSVLLNLEIDQKLMVSHNMVAFLGVVRGLIFVKFVRKLLRMSMSHYRTSQNLWNASGLDRIAPTI